MAPWKVAFATPHWIFVAAASIIMSVQTEVQVRRNAAALPTGHDGNSDTNYDGKMIRYPGYGIFFAPGLCSEPCPMSTIGYYPVHPREICY